MRLACLEHDALRRPSLKAQSRPLFWARCAWERYVMIRTSVHLFCISLTNSTESVSFTFRSIATQTASVRSRSLERFQSRRRPWPWSGSDSQKTKLAGRYSRLPTEVNRSVEGFLFRLSLRFDPRHHLLSCASRKRLLTTVNATKIPVLWRGGGKSDSAAYVQRE